MKLLVHIDAARRAPRAWMTALWWRVQGKRWRARAQFAPLLAASPRAYRLWLEREHRPESVSVAGPSITALVQAGPGQEETLRSLAAQEVLALVIGDADFATLAEAATRIDWHARPWLMPLAAGDVLAPGAAAAYRTAAAATQAAIVYADDDLLDAGGRRTSPHFKPDWNSELFRHFDYLTGACIVRAPVAAATRLAGSDWASALVTSAVALQQPVHLPHVLHHRRTRPRPNVPLVLDTADVAWPRVSVIVPTRNRLDLLRTCLDGVARTRYPDIEVIIVDNGSDDPATLNYLAALDPARYRVLHHPGPFNFSALNNHAARSATGDLLCLLNNDIDIIDGDWLRIMVGQALRDDVGAVGAQLLYPDGRIQHAGVVLGIGGGAAHAHRLLGPDEEGYFRRHALPQFVSAVTAACLVVQRARFAAVGGLDEANFAVAFNDVDLCLRLNRAGWQSLYEPRAQLIHHESVSRGLDRDAVGAARLAGELAALKERWGTSDAVDPYHHPQLSPFSERFVVNV